jgi:SAM-dependent methyltransferase
MQVTVTRRETCRLCDSRRLELVVPLAPTPVAEKYVSKEELDKPTPKYPLDLHLCLDCGHVQMVDVVDPAFLFDSYTYESGKTKRIVEHFDEIAESTLKGFNIPRGGLVVDIGSNDGSLLGRFQARGMRVLGVDPAKEIARKAAEAGIPTLPDFISVGLAKTIRQQHGPASIVCAFNVFAHNDDLAGMADSIRELLAPDGVLVFEASYLLDILDRMLLGTIFHEHVSHHSVKPLISFLHRHGLELIDVQRNSIQGGSIVGSVQLLGGPHVVSGTVTDLLEIERARHLDKPATLRRFSHDLDRLRNQLKTLIADLKGQGKTVWGYGAARSGTTLIAQMDLAKVITRIVDDSPDKQNKFSPGDHIPIGPTKELYDRMPDYAFILAWIHAQPIIRNNRRYLEAGGRFILCVPEVRVIGPEYSEPE